MKQRDEGYCKHSIAIQYYLYIYVCTYMYIYIYISFIQTKNKNKQQQQHTHTIVITCGSSYTNSLILMGSLNIFPCSQEPCQHRRYACFNQPDILARPFNPPITCANKLNRSWPLLLGTQIKRFHIH